MVTRMFNLDSSLEQTKQKRQEGQAQVFSGQAELDVEMYSGGFFDGLIGSEPSSPSSTSYSKGYQLGYREYWATRRSVEIATEA